MRLGAAPFVTIGITIWSGVAYWTDIFTLETWAQAEQRDYQVTGFPAPTHSKGGYSVHMFERVRPGDVLLCYCKRPASRWIGALRVTGEAFIGDEPIWGFDDMGQVRYPWRFPTEPIVTLEPQQGLPGEVVAQSLGFLSRLSRWGTFLQRSLNAVPDRDGARLVEMLREPREAVPIVVPPRRGRARVSRDADAPEPTPIDAHAQPVTLVVAPPDEGEPSVDRTHMEIEAKLRDIGLHEGYDVWVADRGTIWNDEPLGTGCLGELPVVASEQTRKVMRNIDVIWFRRGAGHPVRFFEIEHSTTVYSGLLRFNDVIIDFPITEAFVVGEDDKTRRKFEREITRRTFEHSGLISVTHFLTYEDVRQIWQRYRSVGAGSKEWSVKARPAGSEPASA